MRTWLIKARKKAGLTQRELGDLIDKDITTIGKYENGSRTPRWPVAQRIGRVLDIDWTLFYSKEESA
ncbi:MAG: helix-turn-helix transcriptional regulator [Oscillospiraceae bacterium]